MSSWKCDICGYVHQGSAAPLNCTLCGAERKHFSALIIKRQPSAAPVSNRWRCSICDHIDTGSKPPERCGVCNASSSMFEAVSDETPWRGSSATETILILGSGIAGLTAAEEARKCSQQTKITLIGKEPGLPYYRLNLTRLLAGDVTEQELPIQTNDWFTAQNISLLEGEALRIDRQNKQVELRDGRCFRYDKLILASGSHPFVPPLAGATRDGVRTLRTITDAQQILERLRPGITTLCIGGGLLGLETAAALARRGAKVTVLEGHAWLMPRQLPERAANLLKVKLQAMGIEVICAAQVKELAGDEHLRSAILADGREIPAELAVVSAGVRPNSCLARQADLKVKTGVIVDDRMTTSDADILAAGDLAEHRGQLYGIWPASYAQGAVAGVNAAGGNIEFPGMSLATRVKIVGIDLFSVGQLNTADASYRLLEAINGETYCGLVCRDNHLVGAALFGDTSLAGILKEAIEKEHQLPELPQLHELFPQLAS